MTNTTSPAGWYVDPRDQSVERWFDGQQWTHHVRQRASQPAPAHHGRRAEDRGVLENVGTAPAAGSRGGVSELEAERSRWLEFASREFRELTARFDATKAEMERELAELDRQIVSGRAAIDLQEIGLLFDGEHPTAKSTEFGAAVDEARSRRKALAKQKSAVVAGISLTMENSASKGRKMTEDLTKLMLRAYNGEVDALVKSTTATNGERKADALDKKREQIERLGRMIQLTVSREYHDLARYEIQTTSRWKAAQLVEKELEREHKARLREEKKAMAELEAAQAKLDKELHQYRSALAAMEADDDADPAAVAELRAEVAAVEEKAADVTRRQANTRAGYVYVISNPGTMGADVVKIGMTRRLDPMDRVRELGDASVPFRFSVHALVFSEDAVSLELELHRQFADYRVNRVNQRREFFKVRPDAVREALVRADAHLVEWDATPIDEEWEASQ